VEQQSALAASVSCQEKRSWRGAAPVKRSTHRDFRQLLTRVPRLLLTVAHRMNHKLQAIV
jgi:hypothetical protein